MNKYGHTKLLRKRTGKRISKQCKTNKTQCFVNTFAAGSIEAACTKKFEKIKRKGQEEKEQSLPLPK